MDRPFGTMSDDVLASLVRLIGALEPPPLEVEEVSGRTDIHRFRFALPHQCDRLLSIVRELHYADSQLSQRDIKQYRASKDVLLEELHSDAYQAFSAYAMPLLKSVTETVWGWECNALTDVAIIEYRPGSYFKEHVDAAESQVHSLRHMSFVVYLSDGFEGGETMFRRQSVTIKPMRGWGIVFPAGITHPHESTIVTSGVKYVIVGWLTRRVSATIER